jgi:hypothetical protein
MNPPLPLGQFPWSWLGDEDADVVVCGHSHRYAMVQAIGEQCLEPAFRAAVLSQTTSHHVEVDEEYWSLVRAIEDRPVAITWEGNVHNGHFLFKHSPAFRLAYAGVALDDTDDTLLVPVEMVRTLLQPSLARLDSLLERLAARTRVFLIGSPPPKPERLIRRALSAEPGWLDLARQRGFDLVSFTMSSPSLRIAAWSILQDLYAEMAVRAGAEFVPVPARARDEDGCLRQELCGVDATHGNASYGALMWREIFAAVHRHRSTHA